MTQSTPSNCAFRVADLSGQGDYAFQIEPTAAVQKAIATELGLSHVRKLRFEGNLRPRGKHDWLLSGKLGATVEQPCAVTLEPVRTRIDAAVTRLYVADFEDPTVEEAEMPEDDSQEALGDWIDPEAVMIEALSLEVPEFPRAPGVSFGTAIYADKGVEPLTDEAVKPFAGLASLRDKLKDQE